MSSFKKIPYGLTDFELIIKEDFYFVDKTRYIQLIEESPRYLFLIRPRRFGKSLLLSILEDYYDVAKKKDFDLYFSKTWIGKNPTSEQGTYLILKFNFSQVNPEEDLLEEWL